MNLLVLFGEMTFLEDEAIIHKVHEIKVMHEDAIDDYMIENHECYLIPSQYKGKLTMESFI